MILTKKDLSSIPKAKLQQLYKHYYPDKSYWGLNKDVLIAEILKKIEPEPEPVKDESPASVRIQRIRESENG